MKLQSIHQALNRKLRLWILPSVLSLGIFSTNVSQAALTNTLTWIGGINTNAASSNNYTSSPAYGAVVSISTNTNGVVTTNYATFNLANTGIAYVYPGTNTQTGTQVLDYGGAATVYTYGLTVTNWTSNVIMTNMGDWRVDSGGLVASNAAASTLSIITSGGSGQLGGDTTFSGNMAVNITALGGHSTTARTLTQNLTNLTISNFIVNAATILTNTPKTTFTFSGTGNTTIFGAISNKTLFLNNGGNSGYLLVNSGRLNIATTSSANTNWVSGLVLSNNGSVYVLGQLSLGSPMFDVRMGGNNATNRPTFGLISTSSLNSVDLTNNFVISNTAAAANVFKPQSGKTLTLSGTISGSVNGTIVADAGTLVLSGANTALSLPFVVTNSGTLVASNNNALGSGSVTVASGATLRVNAAITNSVVNNGGVTIADGGSLVTAKGYSGLGSLSVGATGTNTASFTSSQVTGTNSVGALSMTGNATLGMDVGAQIKSSGAVAISGTSNLITVTGTPVAGINNLVVGTSLTGASASSIALNGSAVGSPATPIALGDNFTDSNGNTYTFTKSSTALQLVVEGASVAQNLAFAYASGNWNTDKDTLNWNTNPGGALAAFKTGDSTAFTNTATVTVDQGGVSPNAVSFSNPSSTAVAISGGAINATTVSANGAGSVNVSSDLTVTAGITLNSGDINLAKTTVDSGGITVAGGSLTNSGATTITAGGLSVSSGRLTVTDSGSISAGAVNVTGGTVSGAGSITGSSYSVTNATYNVSLSGSSPLTVSGTSTLGGDNSGFSGTVSVTGGNLNLGGSSSLGTGALNLSEGSVITLSSGTLANSIALGAGGGGVSNSSAVTITGAVTNASGQVSQILSKSGAGVLTLSGTVGTTNPMIGFSINEGTLQLAGSQYYMTNLSVASGAKLLINGGVLNTRQIKAAGPGVIEVTNLVTWSNSLGSSSFTNPIVVDANSSFISGPMTSTTASLTFENGVSGPGYLEINRCVDLSTNINNINGWIGVGSMKVNTGALLKIANGGFTNPSATITNLGKININNSSSVTNIISTTYPGVTGVTTVTNKFLEISGGGVIANSGSQTIYLDGLISGSNKISMEGSSASSSIYLTRSNSFTGGIDFAGPTATNNNGTVWFLNSNALGSGPIINSINSSNAQVKTYTPAGGSVQNWILTNTVNTGTANTAVMAFGAGNSNSLTLVGQVSGGGQLKVTSSTNGELRVDNILNNYSGGTEVGTGAIVISNAAVLGTGPVNFGTTADSILKVTDTTTLTNAMTISGISGTSTNTTAYTAYLNVSANKTFTNSGGLNNKLSVGVTTNEQKYGGNLVKQGSGTAELSGVNGYSGSTTINDGTLALSGATLSTPLVSLTGSSNAVLKLKATDVLSTSVSFTGDNSSANTGTVDFNAAGSYTFNRYGDSAANPGLNIAFTNSSSGAVTATFTNGTNYITDPTGSGGGKTIYNCSTNLTLVFSGVMEIGSSADNRLGLDGDGNFTLNGSVINSGTGIRALTKSGTGKATLNAVNSYNGATTVSGGTLEVGASGSLPVASAVTVSNGATLNFLKNSGVINLTNLTVSSGGTLAQNLVTISSSGAVNLTGATLTVNGTPSLASYTLVTGSSLTGTPTLSPAVPNYKLSPSNNSLYLVAKTVPVIGVTPGTYTYSGSIQGPGTANVSTGGSTGGVTLSYSGTTLSGETYGPSAVPPTAPGSYTVTSSVAEDSDYAVGSASAAFTIAKVTLTGSFTAQDKEYDGNNSAAVSGRSVSGKLGNEDVSLSGGTATFANANVGTDKTVSLVGATLTGSAAGNYTLGSVSTATAKITAKSLTGSFTAQDKEYDGNNSATVSGRSVSGKVGADDVDLSGGTATFDDANVGTAKTVTLAGATLAGTAKDNYTLEKVGTRTAKITTKGLTVTGAKATDRAYNGTDTVEVKDGSLSGVVGIEEVILGGVPKGQIGSADAGNDKVVTVTGYTISGTHSGNYFLSQPTDVKVNITAKELTGSFTAQDKEYDGNISATVSGRSVSGNMDNEDVSLSGGTATFANANVGTGKTVTLVGATLSGAAAGNYTLGSVGATTAAITAKALTVTGLTGANKEYDGGRTASATGAAVLSGVISADSSNVTLGGTPLYIFVDASVGNGKTITTSGYTLGGSAAGNYSLTQPSLTAKITGKALTGSFTAQDKEYDGNNSATVSGRSVSGKVGTDDVNLSGGTATFVDANVGTAKTVTLAGATLSGSAAGNYTLGSVSNATAKITAKSLTGSFTAANKKYDGTVSASVTGRSVVGKIGSDDVILSGGTATFADENIGTGKTVTLTGASLVGTAAGNYTLVSVSTTIANITPPGSSFTGVGYASGTENNIAANGLSNLMNYALGQNGPNGQFPSAPVLRTANNTMTLTATVRTDDSSLKFYGQWSSNLSANDWGQTDHSAELTPSSSILSYSQSIDASVPKKFIRFKVLKQ